VNCLTLEAQLPASQALACAKIGFIFWDSAFDASLSEAQKGARNNVVRKSIRGGRAHVRLEKCLKRLEPIGPEIRAISTQRRAAEPRSRAPRASGAQCRGPIERSGPAWARVSPFRDLKTYPYDKRKLEALERSIEMSA
jgi:hypothetical protein